jgi:hypothetical protein
MMKRYHRGGESMDLESMSREDLIQHIKETADSLDNVIIFWGGKKEFKETFRLVAENKDHEYTEAEARSAATILKSESAFDEFIEMVRDSFERGGINYVISEKISAIMEELAQRHGKG